jgi:hypothetical protein
MPITDSSCQTGRSVQPVESRLSAQSPGAAQLAVKTRGSFGDRFPVDLAGQDKSDDREDFTAKMEESAKMAKLSGTA